MRRSWSLLSGVSGPLRCRTAEKQLRWESQMTVDPFPNGTPPYLSQAAFPPSLQSCVYQRVHPRVHPGCSYHTQVPHCASRPASGDASISATREEAGLGVRLLKLFGWMGGFYSRKAVLIRASKTLYENCMDNLKYEEFFEVCSMPDSFQSWFMVAHLHVWFFMVRLKREGKDGEYLIRQVVATFWHDVEHRMRAMEIFNSMAATKNFRALVQQFYGLTLAYEEGLLCDDKLLAAAIWRNMIFEKADTDPAQLVKMVDYIRRQVQHMDKQDSKALLERGSISLLPFSAEQNQQLSQS